MHYLPVLVFVAVLKLAIVCALGGPRRVWSFAKDCFTVGEDHWTWSTRNGETFEDAVIEKIETNELVLKHRYGVVRLAVDRLSEKSRAVLFHTQMWAEHIASGSMEKIANFGNQSAEVEVA